MLRYMLDMFKQVLDTVKQDLVTEIPCKRPLSLSLKKMV